MLLKYEDIVDEVVVGQFAYSPVKLPTENEVIIGFVVHDVPRPY